ncbi:MAG: histone deacetylase [Chloroflexota bacterium]
MATGYVFDEIFLKHNLPAHPENANRLTAVLDYLTRHELLPQLQAVPSRPATPAELTRSHHPRHIQRVEETCRNGGGMLDPDTYTNEYSYEAAVRAVGGLVELATAVIAGKLDNGFALVRPPGHHATYSRAMGFCLFGNIAIAARSARFDQGLARVAIVDFDVHHGNGTQAILDEDPTVMFVSSHQYPYYPGTGALGDIGQGEARGSKVNLPLSPGVGDNGFKQLYGQVVFPLLRRFQPELILVSAGFDAHWDDPLASLGLSLTGYHWLCRGLVDLAAEICEGRIVFVLEGGYNLKVLAPGVGNAFRVLLGRDDIDDPLGPSPWPEPGVSVSLLKETHNLL